MQILTRNQVIGSIPGLGGNVTACRCTKNGLPAGRWCLRAGWYKEPWAYGGTGLVQGPDWYADYLADLQILGSTPGLAAWMA